eukprot:m.190396 g.190396  ORF g.190396 m.190396 type:complete len:320 (-) comp18559_c0_seq2:511-1470(-)
MMDFARSHMESHGWSEGKGLGKSESGRAEAVKVQLKFDKSGIGESGNNEHTFNWWDHAFNRASSNIEVCDDSSDEEVVVRSKSETHKGLLSTRPPKKAAQAVFYGGFVKAATKDDELSAEKSKDFSSKPMTDEEIFKACGGRTGHKAARHGTKMKGKLSRMQTADEVIKKTLPGDASRGADTLCISSIVSDSDSDDDIPSKKKVKKKKSNTTGTTSKSSKKSSTSRKKRKREGTDVTATNTGADDGASTEKLKKSKKAKKSPGATSTNAGIESSRGKDGGTITKGRTKHEVEKKSKKEKKNKSVEKKKSKKKSKKAPKK